MNNALLSIRTNDTTKKEITEFANSVGLSVSAFVTVILKQVIKEDQIVLSFTFEPTPYLRNVMKNTLADRKADRNYMTINNKAELNDFFKKL